MTGDEATYIRVSLMASCLQCALPLCTCGLCEGGVMEMKLPHVATWFSNGGGGHLRAKLLHGEGGLNSEPVR